MKKSQIINAIHSRLCISDFEGDDVNMSVHTESVRDRETLVLLESMLDELIDSVPDNERQPSPDNDNVTPVITTRARIVQYLDSGFNEYGDEVRQWKEEAKE